MSTKPNFDVLASPYRWMEYLTFGPLLMHTRLAFLDRMGTSRRALILGDGDGRFTRALLNANPTILVDAVDISPAMLRSLVRRAAPHCGRLRTFCADLRDWQPELQSYDLIITHFFLDCLTDDEVALLVRRIQPALAPNAQWVLSEFAIPAGPKFFAMLARLLVRFLYFAFQMLTGLETRKLPEFGTTFAQAGFTRLERKGMLRGILIAELWRGNASR